MQGPDTAGTVFGPFEQMWHRILEYLPNLAAGLLLILLGLAVCWLVKRIVMRIVLLMRLDRPLRNVRWARGLVHADVRHSLANAIGLAAAAMAFLVFLESAVVAWQLDVLAKLIGGFVFYLPQLIVGLAMLPAGSAIVAAVSGRIRTGLATEGVAYAGLAGKLAYRALMIFAVALVLEQPQIAPNTVQTAFKFGLGTVGLAAVLAFGLGSRDAVARMWTAILDRSRREG
jgi:hypothetical protein